MIELNVRQMTRNIKAVQTASKELRALLVGEETMTGIARQAATIVKARTQSGKDADGASLAPYTPKYAKKRSDAGRSTTPDMTWKGQMLGNMAAAYIEPGRAAVIFTSSEQANKAAGNSKKRDFFDIRLPNEISALIGELDRRVARVIKQLGLA